MTSLHRTSGFRAAVFDFGGVMGVSPLTAMASFARALDAPADALIELIFGDHVDDPANPWHAAERGELSLDERFAELMGPRFAARAIRFDLELFVSWVADAVVEARPAMVTLVKQARAAGYRTALLTNSVPEFWPVINKTIPVAGLFDVVVDSCREGLRKPDERIYELTARRLGVEAEACVFIDDFAVNVEGARRAGMRAVHFVDPAESEATLRALLGLTAG